MTEKTKNNLLAGGEVISALITALSLVLDIFGVANNLDLRIIALIGFVIFFILVWINIVSQNNKLYEKTPKIELIENPIIIDDVVMQSSYEDKKSGEVAVLESISCMAHVAFSNNPKHPTDQNSPDKVRAEITFYNKNNKKLLGPLQGRWVETDEPSQLRKGEKRKIESIDFPNNGADRVLDLFLKYPEELFCYGFNNDSYGHINLQNPNFSIKENQFFILVELKGAYLPAKKWKFEVKTKGMGDTFQIRNGENWLKIENSQAKQTISIVKRFRNIAPNKLI